MFEDKNEFVGYETLGARPASTNYDTLTQKDRHSARDSQNEVSAVSEEDGSPSQSITESETHEAAYSQIILVEDVEGQIGRSHDNEKFALEDVVPVYPSSPSKKSSFNGKFIHKIINFFSSLMLYFLNL